MPDEIVFPEIRSVVFDCPDAHALAEFYRVLFGFDYRPGDEAPASDQPDPNGNDWLVLRNPNGTGLAFQQVDDFSRPTWPEGSIPQQLHLDTSVPTKELLDAQHERAKGLGARLLYDRSEVAQEPLRVYADPAGHPFCIFVAPSS